MKKENITLISISFILFLSMIGLIYYLTPIVLNSDAAFYMLLVKEQMQQGKFFPDGMCYSTSIFVIGWRLFAIPFLKMFPGHYIRSKDLAEFVAWILVYAVIVFGLRMKLDKEGEVSFAKSGRSGILKKEAYNYVPACICMILLTIPFVNSPATDEYMLFAQYLMQVLWNMIAVWMVHIWLQSIDSDTVSVRKYVICMVVLFLIAFLPNLGSFRSIMTITVPLIVSVFLVILYQNMQEKKSDIPWLRLGIGVLVIILATIAAVISYRLLSKEIWSVESQRIAKMVDSEQFVDSIESMIESFFTITGNHTSYPVISLGGGMKILNYIYCILLFGVFPVIGLVRFKKIDDTFLRFLILYSWISNLLICMMAVLIGKSDVARYFLSVYLNDIILTSVLIGRLFLTKRNLISTGMRWGRTLLVTAVVIFAVFNHIVYWNEEVIAREYDGPQSLVMFLEEQDLDYGYATYWHAHKNTILSGGQVQINNVRVTGQNVVIHPWLTNRHYYEPEYHKGTTFLLLTQEEAAEYFPEGIENSKYGIPSRILMFHYSTYDHKNKSGDYVPEYRNEEFVIYVYDYNIMEK